MGANKMMSDPSAVPTGTEEQDKRIEDAIAQNRWVKMAAYAEEWQRVILLTINGLSGLAKLVKGGVNTEETGAVKMLEGKQTKTDDFTMLVDAMDSQFHRMDAVCKHLHIFEFSLNGKGLPDDFVDRLDQVHKQMLNIMGELKMKTMRDDLIRCRDDLLDMMDDAGFKFEVKILPIVGAKYYFAEIEDGELLYIGEGDVPVPVDKPSETGE